MPIVKTFAKFSPSEILDVEKVDEMLTIKNPDYAAKARFGGHFDTELPDKFLTFSYFDDEADNDDVLLPRNFHRLHPELFKITTKEKNLCTYGKPLRRGAKFTGSFEGEREYQQTYVDSIDYSDTDLLYEVPTGHGKTALGIYTIVRRGVKAFVLVPTYQIASQWLNSINAFSNLRGLIADPAKFNKTDFTQVDVLVMSFDLFDSRKDGFPPNFEQLWGHVLLDEAHVVGAPTYQPVLERVHCMFRTALTATFRRGDGMAKILQYHFGTKYTMSNQFPAPYVIPVETGFGWDYLYSFAQTRGSKKLQRKKDEFTPQQQNINLFKQWLKERWPDHMVYAGDILEVHDLDGMLAKAQAKFIDGEKTVTIRKIIQDIKASQMKSVSTMETYVSMQRVRNAPLLELTRYAVDKCDRKVLVISKRKAQLTHYYEVFQRLGYKCGYIVGSDKQSRDPEYLKWCNDEAQVIFGIYQIAKQGLDIPNCDTLVLLNWLKDVEQPAGRINRLIPGKKPPIVIYPIDDRNMVLNMYNDARKVTRNCMFERKLKSIDEVKLLL
jgi:superfamily II DNA or RNA helicase